MSTQAQSSPSTSGGTRIASKLATFSRLLAIRALIEVLRQQVAVILDENKSASDDGYDPEADARVVEACRLLGVNADGLQATSPNAATTSLINDRNTPSPLANPTSHSPGSQADDEANNTSEDERGQDDDTRSMDGHFVMRRRSPPTNFTAEDFATWTRTAQRDIFGGLTYDEWASS